MLKRKTSNITDSVAIFILLKAITLALNSCLILSSLLALGQLTIPIYEQITPITRENCPPSIAFSPNSQYLAITNSADKAVSIFDPISFKAITKINIDKQQQGSTAGPNSVAFSADSMLMAVVNAGISAVLIYNTENLNNNPQPTIITNETETASPLSVAFSPNISDNSYLAIAYSNSTVHIYNTVNLANPKFTINTNLNKPASVAFSPEISGNYYLAIANYGNNTVGISTYDKNLNSFGTPISVSVGENPVSLAFSSEINGNFYLAVANSNLSESSSPSLSIIKINNRFPVKQTIKFSSKTNKLLSVAFSPDGKYLAGTNDASDKIDLYSYSVATDSFMAIAKSPFKVISDYIDTTNYAAASVDSAAYSVGFSNNSQYMIVATNEDLSSNNIFNLALKLEAPETGSKTGTKNFCTKNPNPNLCVETSIYTPIYINESSAPIISVPIAEGSESSYMQKNCQKNRSAENKRSCSQGTTSISTNITIASQNLALTGAITAIVTATFVKPSSAKPLYYAWVLTPTSTGSFSKYPFPKNLNPPVLYTTGPNMATMCFSVYPGAQLQCAAIFSGRVTPQVSAPITFEYPPHSSSTQPLSSVYTHVIFKCYNCQNIMP